MAVLHVLPRGLVLMVVAALLTAGPAAAAPYWVAWEGNDYPENEGWVREGDGTFPTRSLNGGVMTLDSLASTESEDFYRIYDIANPGLGEEFVVQWRVRVDEVDWDNPNFRYDPGWAMNSADGWRATFLISVDQLQLFAEQAEIDFEPGVFHNWELRSTDMRNYTIMLDGVPVAAGAFVSTGLEARMSWGDLVPQTASRVEWDYFRFGVVPEMATCWSLFIICLTFKSWRGQ